MSRSVLAGEGAAGRLATDGRPAGMQIEEPHAQERPSKSAKGEPTIKRFYAAVYAVSVYSPSRQIAIMLSIRSEDVETRAGKLRAR